jgi:hypothetical protein
MLGWFPLVLGRVIVSFSHFGVFFPMMQYISFLFGRGFRVRVFSVLSLCPFPLLRYVSRLVAL